jgi:hypothetical protein
MVVDSQSSGRVRRSHCFLCLAQEQEKARKVTVNLILEGKQDLLTLIDPVGGSFICF